MAIHLCRDYLTQNITTNTRGFIPSYLLTIFMRRVLGYTYIGDTNYPINTVGTLLLATGDSTPTSTPTFAAGTRAGINLGSQREFYVSIPASVRTVSGADIGRLLVLKSTANPRYNSGIFLISGFETSTNAYIIDYRVLNDYPPIEAADSMNWYLYEKDLNCPIYGNANTKTSSEYRGDGNSTTPRIILQSPHAINWQVRICNETTTDAIGGNTFGGNYAGAAGNCSITSVAPGYGGTIGGDFATYGQHFHAPMWYNSSSTIYQGGAPGFGDDAGAGNQMRITIVGDDTGQGVVMYCRRPGNASVPKSTITCFGLAENEPSPIPVNNYARLFCIGSAYGGNVSAGFTQNGNYLNEGSLLPGTIGGNSLSQGMSSTSTGVPVMAAASFWAYITGGAQGSSPIFDGSASDTPFISTTELLPIDIIKGTLANWNAGATQAFPFAPYNIGTIPHLREGRSNFGDFSPTTDTARSYQHLRRGLYIPWGGPKFIP